MASELNLPIRLVLIVGGTVAYLGLAILGEGGFAVFSQPALTAGDRAVRTVRRRFSAVLACRFVFGSNKMGGDGRNAAGGIFVHQRLPDPIKPQTRSA